MAAMSTFEPGSSERPASGWPSVPPEVPPTSSGSWPGSPMPPGSPIPPAPSLPPSTPGGGSRGRLALIGIAAGLVVLLLAGTAWVVTRPDRGRGVAAGASSTTSSAPATTATSAPTTSSTPTAALVVPTGDPVFDEGVAHVARFVEQTRGHEFKQPVKVELVDDDQFNQRLLADFDQDVPSMRTDERVLKALQLIPASSDYVDALRRTVAEGVLGFYDPETKALVVRGTELTPFIRETMAHELTHALDDQWFDLDRPELDDAPDESSFAFQALTEGSARYVEGQFDDTLSASDSQLLEEESSKFGAQMDLSGVPDYIVESLGIPYQLGLQLVEHLHSTGGSEAVDAAFVTPPTTSEQVLNPELMGLSPSVVETPAADGDVIDDGVIGELGFLQLLHSADPGSGVDRAATDGWAGDHYIAYASGGRTCVRDSLRVDTPAAGDAFEEALRSWTDAATDATVTRADVLTLTVSSCS